MAAAFLFLRASAKFSSLCITPQSRAAVLMLWCWGRAVNESPVEGRVIQLFMYMRSHPDDNHYVRIHPLRCLFLCHILLGDRSLWSMCRPSTPSVAVLSPKRCPCLYGIQQNKRIWPIPESLYCLDEITFVFVLTHSYSSFQLCRRWSLRIYLLSGVLRLTQIQDLHFFHTARVSCSIISSAAARRRTRWTSRRLQT